MSPLIVFIYISLAELFFSFTFILNYVRYVVLSFPPSFVGRWILSLSQDQRPFNEEKLFFHRRLKYISCNVKSVTPTRLYVTGYICCVHIISIAMLFCFIPHKQVFKLFLFIYKSNFCASVI